MKRLMRLAAKAADGTLVAVADLGSPFSLVLLIGALLVVGAAIGAVLLARWQGRSELLSKGDQGAMAEDR